MGIPQLGFIRGTLKEAPSVHAAQEAKGACSADVMCSVDWEPLALPRWHFAQTASLVHPQLLVLRSTSKCHRALAILTCTYLTRYVFPMRPSASTRRPQP